MGMVPSALKVKRSIRTERSLSISGERSLRGIEIHPSVEHPRCGVGCKLVAYDGVLRPCRAT